MLCSINLYGVIAATRESVDAPLSDFFAIWSYTHIAAGHSAALLYNPVWLHEQQVVLGMPAGVQNPFPYPPFALLLIWPLAWLPLRAAYCAWMAAGLLLYATALLAGSRNKALLAAGCVLAPASAACLAAGQTGFLSAALVLGGLRILPRNQVVAGLLFGVASYKPQLGLLLPVALCVSGRWRCIGAAAAAILVLACAAASVFGPAIWLDWVRALPGYAALFAQANHGNPLMPTVLSNMEWLGAGPFWAQAAQIGGALAGTLCVAWAWRRLPPMLVSEAPAGAVLIAATFLAGSHSFVYDLPLLAGGVLWFAADRIGTAGGLTGVEITSAVAALMFPAVLSLHGTQAPVSTPAIAGFLLVAMRGAGWPGFAVPLRTAKPGPDHAGSSVGRVGQAG